MHRLTLTGKGTMNRFARGDDEGRESLREAKQDDAGLAEGLGAVGSRRRARTPIQAPYVPRGVGVNIDGHPP